MDKRGVLKNPIFWIMAILSFISIIAFFILYFNAFNISNKFVMPLKIFSFTMLISACSIYLFVSFSYNLNTCLSIKIIFSILYIFLCSLILAFAFKQVTNCFSNSYQGNGDLFNCKEFGYALWFMSILTAIGFMIYYFIFHTLNESDTNFLDILFTIFMPTIVGVILFIIVCFIIYKFFGMLEKIPTGGSSRKSYDYTNSMGCHETVYSEDGRLFFDADGSYKGTSDDNGETIYYDP